MVKVLNYNPIDYILNISYIKPGAKALGDNNKTYIDALVGIYITTGETQSALYFKNKY